MNVAALLHLALSGLLVLITGMPFLKTPLWWVRAGEFPRVQIACLLLALLLVLPWLTDYPLGLGWPVGLALAVCSCGGSCPMPDWPALRLLAPPMSMRPTGCACSAPMC